MPVTEVKKHLLHSFFLKDPLQIMKNLDTYLGTYQKKRKNRQKKSIAVLFSKPSHFDFLHADLNTSLISITLLRFMMTVRC